MQGVSDTQEPGNSICMPYSDLEPNQTIFLGMEISLTKSNEK